MNVKIPHTTIDMPFPPSPPFNPSVSTVPILHSSSGDPKAKQDPKSIASVGANIQAMTDQAKADMLYDAPVKETAPGTTKSSEGFRNEYKPWIVNSEACRRFEGFSNYGPDLIPKLLVVAGAALLICSFISR